MTNSASAFEESQKIRDSAALVRNLEEDFFQKATYNLLCKRAFQVLELREELLKKGITEQKGAALIGAVAVGKTHMAEQVVDEYAERVMASGGCEFGPKIVSVFVQEKAPVLVTRNAILQALGYPTSHLEQKIAWRRWSWFTFLSIGLRPFMGGFFVG